MLVEDPGNAQHPVGILEWENHDPWRLKGPKGFAEHGSHFSSTFNSKWKHTIVIKSSRNKCPFHDPVFIILGGFKHVLFASLF